MVGRALGPVAGARGPANEGPPVPRRGRRWAPLGPPKAPRKTHRWPGRGRPPMAGSKPEEEGRKKGAVTLPWEVGGG